MNSNNENNNAFTLVELAIVVVIIGMIIGGIIGGASLIESGKRQEVINNVKGFETAINAFRLEYNQLPGDFDEATQYWTGGVTADGDNDKIIEQAGNEIYRVWEHLSLAEIVNQNYDYDLLSGSWKRDRSELEKAFPLFDGVGIYVFPIWFGEYPNWLAINAFSTSFANPHLGGAVPPKFLRAIDKKIDDGEADHGIVKGVEGNPFDFSSGNICTDYTGSYLNFATAPPSSWSYALSHDEPTCQAMFKILEN